MMSEQKSYLKAGLWYMVGNILIKGVSFIALPIFTRLLSPDDFGKYNIFMSYESILTVILGLGFGGTIKIAYFDFKDKFKDYFSSVIFLTILFSILFDILTIGGYFLFLKPYLPEIWSQGLLHLLVFSSLGTALYNLISTKYVIYAEYKSNLAISAIYTVTNILLSITLCYTLFSAERYLARIVGYTLPIMIIAYGIAVVYMAKSGVLVNKQYWKYAIRLGSPLIIHSLSMILLIQMGKIAINYCYGDAETGVYSVGTTIVGVLTIVLSSFDNAWAPWFYRGLNDNKYAELVAGNNKIAIVFAILCGCFMLIGPEMIMILSTPDYYDAIYSFLPLVVATYINFMYLFAVNQEYYYKKTSTIAIGTVIATTFGFLLNFLLLPIFGYITAAYISCVCNIILLAIHTIVVRKMRKPAVVSYRYLLGMLLFCIFIGVITIGLKDYMIWRFLIVVALSVLLSNYAMIYLKKRKQNTLK